MAKTVIHFNRQRLAHNKKHGTCDPVLSVLCKKQHARYSDEVLIHDRKGRVVARVLYRADKPLKCGAHAWVEAYHPVTPVE